MLYVEDFNIVVINDNGHFARIEELNKMVECGAITINREKLEEYGVCISIKSACTVTITPKIQYVYEYSPSTLLVLPISSETHYNIKNVGVAFNIQNRDIPNYGSSNYDVNEDVGDYIISSYYNYLLS